MTCNSRVSAVGVMELPSVVGPQPDSLSTSSELARFRHIKVVTLKSKIDTALFSVASSQSSSPTPGKARLPAWLAMNMRLMQSKYQNDKFGVIPRKIVASPGPPEWRIRCFDCPGMLYHLGPGETLTNYEVHLKNRLHRSRVNDRLAGRPFTLPPPKIGK